MSTAFEFQLGLTSNFAAALAPTNRALGDAEKHLDKAKDGVSLFEAELGKASGSLGGFGFNLTAAAKGGSLFTFDLVEAGKAAVEVFSKLVEKTAELGKELFKTGAKTQDLDLAIKLNVGEKGAEDIQKLVDVIEQKSRFDDDAIKQALLPSMALGITNTKLLGDMFTAASDLATKSGEGIEGVQSRMKAMSQIRLRRDVSERSLDRMGLNEVDFYQGLAKHMQVSEARARDMVNHNKVSGDKLLTEVLNQRAAAQGGGIGKPTIDSAKTLGGTLDKLSQVGGNAFKQLAYSPGLLAVQGVLDNFVKVMGGDEGKALVNSLGDAFNSLAKTIFGDVSGPDGLAKMKGAIASAKVEVKELADAFRTAWPEIKKGALDAWNVIKDIAGVIRDAIALLNKLPKGSPVTDAAKGMADGQKPGSIGSYAWKGLDLLAAPFKSSMWGVNKLAGYAAEHGQEIAAGLADGLGAGAGKLADAARNMANLPSDVTRKTNKINSPSLLFYEHGLDITAGLAGGMAAGKGDVSSSARSLASDLLEPYDTSAGGAAGVSITMGDTKIEIHVGAGVDKGDAETIAAEVGGQIRVEIKKILVEAGYAYGAGRSL